MTELRLGFAGVGKMGGLMAARLIDAGHPLTVFDANDLAAEPLVKAGAKRARTLQELAGQAEIVFASLPTPEVVREVALGAGGIVESALRNCLSTCRRPDPGWPGWSPKASQPKVLPPWIAR